MRVQLISEYYVHGVMKSRRVSEIFDTVIFTTLLIAVSQGDEAGVLTKFK